MEVLKGKVFPFLQEFFSSNFDMLVIMDCACRYILICHPRMKEKLLSWKCLLGRYRINTSPNIRRKNTEAWKPCTLANALQLNLQLQLCLLCSSLPCSSLVNSHPHQFSFLFAFFFSAPCIFAVNPMLCSLFVCLYLCLILLYLFCRYLHLFVASNPTLWSPERTD